MTLLKVDRLSFGVREKNILDSFSLEISGGELHIILGANGAGKSTLLKLLSSDLKAGSGDIFLKEENINTYSYSELAQLRSVLTQENPFNFPLNVEEVCSLGFVGKGNSEEVIGRTLNEMDLQDLRKTKFVELSGGEKQRVHLARVFCQESELMLLDEPLNNLDIKYQHQLMRRLKSCCDQGKGIICVLHDIGLALRYADSISILKEGALTFQSSMKHFDEQALLSEKLSDAFGVSIQLDKTLQPQVA
jgi:iron complex transport system ATP-binding protein